MKENFKSCNNQKKISHHSIRDLGLTNRQQDNKGKEKILRDKEQGKLFYNFMAKFKADYTILEYATIYEIFEGFSWKCKTKQYIKTIQINIDKRFMLWSILLNQWEEE